MVTFFKQSKKENEAQHTFLTELERMISLFSAEQKIELSSQTYGKRESDVLELLANTLNERHQHQKKQETLFRTIASATKSGTFYSKIANGSFTDPGTVMTFNEDFRHMTGYLTESDLPNHPSSILKFAPSYLQEKVGKEIEAGYARKQDVFTIYTEALTKSGDLLILEVPTHPFYDEHGVLVESIGVAIDITDRQKHLESIENLALKSETINQLIEEAPWSADFSDESAVEMGGRIDYSPQFLQMLGYSKECLTVNKNISKCVQIC